MAFGRNKKNTVPERRRPTGSNISTKSFSYYASKRSVAPPSNATESRQMAIQSEKKRHFKLSRPNMGTVGQQFGTILLVIVLIASVISTLQVDNNPRVVLLNSASHYALHTTKDYQRVVTDSLRSSLLNSNKITVNTRSVVQNLRQQFPEIYDASLVLPLIGHRPTLYVELTQPSIVLKTASQATVIDNSGRALMTSSSSAYRDLKLPILKDESNIQHKVGDVALSSDNVAFVRDVVRQFASQGVGIAKLVLPAGKEELDVYPKHAKYYVRFNLHETTSREQAGTYFAVRQQLQKQGKKAKLPQQYVDVRLVGRAYYH
jgi:hypothetical protein